MSSPSPRPCSALASSAAIEFKKLLDRYVGIPAQLFLAFGEALRGLLRSRPPVDRVGHVVLLKLWGIGNLAMILPYVRAVRRRFPDAHLTFVTLARNRVMLERHPLLDEVLCLRDEKFFALGRDLLTTIIRLRQHRVDLLLDFEQFLRVTGLLAYFSGARQAIGFDTPHQHRARLYQARVPYLEDRHMADVFGDIVRAAGVDVSGSPALEVPVDAEAQRRVEERLGADLPRPWVVLHPGSGDNFPGRRWPAERFAETASRLAQRPGATFLLSGTVAESKVVNALEADLRERGCRSVVNLTGRLDLTELIALLRSADLVISNDTGPVHLASAVGTALVALYGPNTPRLYGPLGSESRALYHPLPCSPCITNLNAKTSQCRLPACILSLTVEEVVAAATELLQRQGHVLSRASS